MKNALLLTNRKITESGGRPEKLRTRKQLLEQYGWKLEFGYVPPPYALSVPRSIIELSVKMRSSNFDAIVAISNPPQLQIVGLALSELTRTPLVSEFRDPLVQIPEIDPDSISGRLRSLLESAIVRRADQIVWIDGIQIADDNFDRKYGGAVPPKWYKLPFLGYEPNNFDPVEPTSFDRFTVTYAGSFYEGWIEPYSFLKGFRQFIDEEDLDSDDARFLVYGDWSKEYDDAVADLGLTDYVDTNDFVPHDELVPILKGSDVLLYIGGDDPRNRRNVPSKIWDYLGARNPILAVVDSEFRSAEFVRSADVGLVADPSRPTEIASQLRSVYAGEYEYDPDSIEERYTRERKMAELAEILDLVAEGRTKVGAWDEPGSANH